MVPLFLISVLAASMSFVIKNESLLESFFQTREAQAQVGQTVELLRQDLEQTQKEFGLGGKYTTSTLKRERAIKDQIAQVMLTAKGKTGQLTLFNSAVFLVLVLVLQLVSVYTAMTLKAGIGSSMEAQIPNLPVSKFPVSVSMETTETESTETRKPRNGNYGNTETEKLKKSESREYGIAEIERTELADTDKSGVALDKNAIVVAVQKLKSDGARFDDLASEFGMSKGTLSKLMQYPLYPVSDEIFLKVKAVLLRKNPNS